MSCTSDDRPSSFLSLLFFVWQDGCFCSDVAGWVFLLRCGRMGVSAPMWQDGCFCSDVAGWYFLLRCGRMGVSASMWQDGCFCSDVAGWVFLLRCGRMVLSAPMWQDGCFNYVEKHSYWLFPCPTACPMVLQRLILNIHKIITALNLFLI